MKTKLLLPLFAAICFASIYTACQRNVDEDLHLPPGIAGAQVQASVSGRILDQQNLPISGARVKVGSRVTSTDLNGYFQMEHVTLHENTGFIQAEMNGYFSGSRTITTIKGSKHVVLIQLIKKEEAGKFSSDAGGMINVAGGASINFEAGSVVNAQTKIPYTGQVSVSAFLLDPTAANFFEIMPGALRGVDEQQKEVGLESYGMMVVELTGAGGEKLQLTGGKPATLRFPIPAALQATAPASIAFWSFNDTTGLWKQEGMATRQGNEYTGKASHFSFWNCDAPFSLVDFKATLVNQHGAKMKGQRVIIKVTDSDNGPTAPGFADTAGVISGKVPAGRPLKLVIFGNCADEILETKNIGSFTSSTDLGTISVNQPADEQVVFTGDIQNCFGEPMKKGYVDIGMQGLYERAPVVNGVLNYAFSRCGNGNTQATIRVTDQTDNVVGGLIDLNVSGNTVSVGQLKVCEGELGEYLIYDMDTVHRKFLPPANPVYFSIFENTSNISYNEADTANYFYLSFYGGQPNSTPEARWLSMYIRKVFYENADAITVQIKEYGAAGEYVSGTFSTNMQYYDNPTGPKFPLTGKFRVKRKQ